MSSLGGHYWEVVTYKSLNHNGSKLFFIRIWYYCRDPCAKADAVVSKSQFHEKKSGSSHWEISVSCTSKGYDNVTTPYYLSCGRLQEVKKKKFQTFNSKSGRGRLQEVPNIVI